MTRSNRLGSGPGKPLQVWALLGCVLLASACASSPPSRFYTLTPLPEAEQRRAEISGGRLAVGIGPVVFPQFLDRPQLVVRDSANRLTLEEFNRWGGTVQDDFLRVWGENLAYLLDTSRILIFPSESRMPLDFRVTAEVVSFEGRADADAVLKVRWSVMDERLQRALASREDVYRCPIGTLDEGETAGARIGFGRGAKTGLSPQRSEATVAAMSRCLGRFSEDVATLIRALPKPVPPEQADSA
jgi:uncharacterized lipoprotein YmbA